MEKQREDQIRRLVAACARTAVTPEEIHGDTALIDELGFDSVGIIDLVIKLEEAGGVPRDDDDDFADHMDTFGRLTEYVDSVWSRQKREV